MPNNTNSMDNTDDTIHTNRNIKILENIYIYTYIYMERESEIQKEIK